MHRYVTPDPSPLEIRQACEEIQRTWTPKAWRSRAGMPNEDQISVIPTFHTESGRDGPSMVPEDRV